MTSLLEVLHQAKLVQCDDELDELITVYLNWIRADTSHWNHETKNNYSWGFVTPGPSWYVRWSQRHDEPDELTIYSNWIQANSYYYCQTTSLWDDWHWMNLRWFTQIIMRWLTQDRRWLNLQLLDSQLEFEPIVTVIRIRRLMISLEVLLGQVGMRDLDDPNQHHDELDELAIYLNWNLKSLITVNPQGIPFIFCQVHLEHL